MVTSDYIPLAVLVLPVASQDAVLLLRTMTRRSYLYIYGTFVPQPMINVKLPSAEWWRLTTTTSWSLELPYGRKNVLRLVIVRALAVPWVCELLLAA